MQTFVDIGRHHDSASGSRSSFGIIVTWVCTYKGFHVGHGAEGVARATTQAVVLSSVLILVLGLLPGLGAAVTDAGPVIQVEGLRKSLRRASRCCAGVDLEVAPAELDGHHRPDAAAASPSSSSTCSACSAPTPGA